MTHGSNLDHGPPPLDVAGSVELHARRYRPYYCDRRERFGLVERAAICPAVLEL
jgi:hypothetical protein